MKPSLTALTHLAFQINAVQDECPGLDLPFAAIHAAADLGLLVPYLAKRLAGHADLFLVTSDPEKLAWLDAALRDTAADYTDRDISAKRRNGSGLCLVMAIILDTIQREYGPSLNPQPDFRPFWSFLELLGIKFSPPNTNHASRL